MLIRSVFKIFFVSLFLLIPFGCEDMEVLFVDCDECYDENPEVADLTIKFTINDENPYVRYILYSGTYDSGDTIAIDTSYTSEVVWSLDTDEYYSVKAEYTKGARTIFAVDGNELRTKKDRSSCDRECYIILGDELDVRLKY